MWEKEVQLCMLAPGYEDVWGGVVEVRLHASLTSVSGVGG
jgi:hypothetical protein